MKNFIKEFKEFAIKGNVVDLAVGVVMGGAFGKIVASLVNDMIMPFILMLTGSSLGGKLELKAGVEGVSEPIYLQWGNFLQTIIDFTIIAFSIFVIIRLINKFKRKEEAIEQAEAVVEKSEETLLLQSILEELRKR